MKEISIFEPPRAATESSTKMAQKLALRRQSHSTASRRTARPRDVKMLEAAADDKICNIVQLIYQAKKYEGMAKDFEFSRRTMEDHWKSGYDDCVGALSHPEVFERPNQLEGVRTFDFRERRNQRSGAISSKDVPDEGKLMRRTAFARPLTSPAFPVVRPFLQSRIL